jgi:UDP-N-acetylmuramoylalanine--D-glutamate ligase
MEKRRLKVAILGYGVEGQSAYHYWSKLGADITICDSKRDLELPDGVKHKLGSKYLDGLEKYDLLVRSPGIRPDTVIAMRPMTSVTREFMKQSPAPIIGVTGTKGKGTTSTLITKMLEAAGKKVWLGGNIGVPALDLLGKVRPTGWVVLELSSFQLMDTSQSPHIGIILMTAQDHLDWHTSRDEYLHAKEAIFRYQKADDIAVYFAQNPDSARLAKESRGTRIPYGSPEGAFVKNEEIWYREQKVCDVADVALLGRHHLENVCAAITAVWQIAPDKKAITKALREFKGLPHRLELVGTVHGVRYFDDSIATTPETTMAAIRAFKDPKVIIVGGSDKGADFAELAEVVLSEKVAAVIAVGTTAPKITAALDKVGYKKYLTGLTDMTQIVEAAHEAAPDGAVVLLAPGCASFDMFASYADRGDQFRAAVSGLSRA